MRAPIVKITHNNRPLVLSTPLVWRGLYVKLSRKIVVTFTSDHGILEEVFFFVYIYIALYALVPQV